MSAKTEQSTASILMKAGGSTVTVTGYTISSVTTLFGIKYLSTFGCSIVQYIPLMFAGNAPKMADHFKENQINPWAYLNLALFLIGGIGLRKLGTMLSDDSNIKRMETFLYGKSTE